MVMEWPVNQMVMMDKMMMVSKELLIVVIIVSLTLTPSSYVDSRLDLAIEEGSIPDGDCLFHPSLPKCAGSDNPYLRVKGQRVWSGRLRSGQEADLSGVALIPFHERARIELWEYDSWDPDDHLGTSYAADSHKGQGDIETRFSNYGTDYILTFRVE